MAKTLAGYAGNQGVIATASAESFLHLGGAISQNTLATSGGEDDRSHIMGVAGVFDGLGVQVNTNARTTATHVLLRKNNADTLLDVSIGAGVTGTVSDIINSVSVVAGDSVCICQRLGTGAGNFDGRTAALAFEAAGGSTVSIVGCQDRVSGISVNFASVTRYSGAIGSYNAWNSSASFRAQPIYQTGGTISNFQMWVASNARTTSTVFTLQINGADTGITVTYGAGETGKKRDTAHTATFAAGDTIGLKVVTGAGTEVLALLNHSFEITWDTTASIVFNYGLDSFDADGTNSYYTPFGGAINDSNTLALRQLFVPFAGTVSDLYVSSGSNAADVHNIMNLNGTDTSLDVLTPAGGGVTPYKDTDPLHAFAVVQGDLLALHHTRASTNLNNYQTASWLMTASSADTNVAPGYEILEIGGGGAPTITTGAAVSPAISGLEIVGLAPTVTFATYAAVASPGQLEIVGLPPTVTIGQTVSPGPAVLEFGFSKPAVNEQRVSQAPILVVAEVVPAAKASQLASLIVAEIVPPSRVSEAPVLIVGEVVPPTRVTQVFALIVADAQPCVQRKCDCWIITRRDGTVLAFTSHDEDIEFLGQTCKACGSLQPTATEQQAAIGTAGNVDLEGLIDSDLISEADLYAGKYDDAFVEVWRTPWDKTFTPEAPVRLAAGWVGNVSHGKAGFKMEVLGPGIRLAQQPLVQAYTPACRWVYGSTQCGDDASARATFGVVTAARNRASITADVVDSGLAETWANGTLIWTYGQNSGVTCEIKSVDFATGAVVLWTAAPYEPSAGDTFELRPGCDKSSTMCADYGRILNFGGFPDVPGTDAILAAPDASY